MTANPPAAERSREVVIDGLRIACRTRGALDGTRPIAVVLHGWGASSAAVASIQACLADSHDSVAPDLPGFGASDPLPAVWGSEEYLAIITALLDQLGIRRANLLGHSRGGHFAFAFAARHPDRVDRLVLIDSAGIRGRRGAAYQARVLAFKAGRRVLQSRPLAGPRGAPLRALFERRFGSADYRAACGPLRGTLVRLVNDDARHLLPNVQAPTLLIWGELDDATPLVDGQLMERLIPDAGLVVFPGAGHFSYADDPGRFCRVVSHFLRPS
ncbi:MAG: alpha/beta hydrolase [Chloroflexota bacterium]|nr:alpha/beta hydrolase [Chloroflexota bacterium]